MQEYNLTLEIYKEGEKSLKQTVLEKLSKKQEFLNNKFKCKNSFNLFPKLQLEQEHIDSVISLLDLQEENIKEVKRLLNDSETRRVDLNRKKEFFYNEMVEYQNKYFELMLKYNKLLNAQSTSYIHSK